MAFPERSIVPHPADGLSMESELIINPAYLCKQWSRWCLALLRCEVLSRMPLQLEELMWQLWAVEKDKKVAFLLLQHLPCAVMLREGPHWHLLSIPPKEPFTRLNLPAKKTEGFWRWHVESCHRSSRNLSCKSHKSWPGAYETTGLVKYKVIALNSLSAICIFNNFSSERCLVPTGIFASIRSWLLI